MLSVPNLASTRAGTPISLRLHLHMVGVDDPIASYQGEIRFAPTALEVTGGTFPNGLVGAWNETSPGVIRFAGVALAGLAGKPALELHATALRELSAVDFTVVLEEVVAKQSFSDLTGRVSRAESPLLTGALLDPGGR